MHGNERNHLLATDSLDECLAHILAIAKTTFRPATSARSIIGDIWRSCKRPENTQIRVPLRNELLEQTCLALTPLCRVMRMMCPVFGLQYKIALSTDFH